MKRKKEETPAEVTLVYETGPDRIMVGGESFRRGEPKAVPAELAARLLKKKTVKFKEVKDG